MQQKLGLFQQWQSEITCLQDKNLSESDFVKNKKLQIYFEELTLKAIEHGDVNLLFVLLNPFLDSDLLKYDQFCAMQDYYCMAHEIMKIELNFAQKFFSVLENYYIRKSSESFQSGMEVQASLKKIFEDEKERVLNELPSEINATAKNRLIPLFWIDGLKYILPSQSQACFYHYAKYLYSEIEEYKRLAMLWQPMYQKGLDEHYEYLQNRINFLTDKVKKLKQAMDQASEYAHEFRKTTIPLCLIPQDSSTDSSDDENNVENGISLTFRMKKTVESICIEREKMIKHYISDFVDSSDDENNLASRDGVRTIRFYRELKKILVEIGSFNEIDATTARAAVLTSCIDPNLSLDGLRDSCPEIKSKTYLNDTLLHVAVRQYYSQPKMDEKSKFSKDVIEQLARFGANVFRKNSQGVSPIRLVFEKQDKELFDSLVEITDQQPFQYLIASKVQAILFKNSELMDFVKKELYLFKDKLKPYIKRIRDASEFPKNTACFIRINESLYEMIDVFSSKLLAYNVSKIQEDIHAPLFGKNQLSHIVKELQDQLFLLEQQDDKLRATFADAVRQDNEEIIKKTYLQTKLSTEVNNILPNKPIEISESVTTTSSRKPQYSMRPRYAEVDEDIKNSQIKIQYDRLFKECRENTLEKKDLKEKLEKNKKEQDDKITEVEERAEKRREEMQKEFQKKIDLLTNTMNQKNFTKQETCFSLQGKQKNVTNESFISVNEAEEIMSVENGISCSLL